MAMRHLFILRRSSPLLAALAAVAPAWAAQGPAPQPPAQDRPPVVAVVMRTAKSTYDLDEAITVNFRHGPGGSTDWIGLYRIGSTPGAASPSIVWAYVGSGTTTAGAGAASGSVTFTNPGLGPGLYEAYFLANDGYEQLAGPATFKVRGIAGPGEPEWVASTFRMRHAVTGSAYSGKIGAYASDPDPSDTLTYGWVAGPAWLSVSASGTVHGTPSTADRGVQTFTVAATDLGGRSTAATMTIEVFAPETERVETLKVLSYNLWHGLGTINGGHRKGIEGILLSDADLVGTQETVDNVSGSGVYQARRLADQLGWYHSPSGAGDSGIISRYPIVEEFSAGIANGVRVHLTFTGSQQVVLYNCHLDHQYYGPYRAHQAGANAQNVLVEERRSQRDEQIAAILSGMSANLALADTVPVLFTGDFNAPSHLDWIPATAAWHGGVGDVAWPTSTECIAAGLVDSFRAIHTDPAATPGDTWSPLFQGSEPQDRIDFIYFKGRRLVPEAAVAYRQAVEVVLGPWGSSTAPALDNTWPSDHSAVLTTFQIN